MNTNPKSNKEPTPESPAAEKPEERTTASITAVADMAQRSIERLAELQRITLDTVVAQSEDTAKAWKSAAKVPEAAPVAAIVELTGRGIQKFVEMQKSLLQLTVQQSTMRANAIKEQGNLSSTAMATFADTVKQGMEAAASAQKIMLDFDRQLLDLVSSSWKTTGKGA